MSGASPDITSPGAGLLVRDDVIWREVGGEIVVLDLAGDAYFTLTSSGAVLWPALVEGSTPASLAALLTSRFSLDQATAETDVRAFLEALSAHGLLEAG
jgi:coenzyme PQQ synthesis protein D (PqqD)